MLLIEYVGHIGLRSLTEGHHGRHLEYFKTLNDARVASVGFIKYNASTTRINKEKNFKIKFQVILVFYRTNVYVFGWHSKPVMYCWCIVKRIVKILSKRIVSVLLKHMVNVLLKRILAHC